MIKKMGLDWRWVTIAEQIGFDTFLETWTLISKMFASDRECLRVPIPHIRRLLRFQRNILIRRLHDEGRNKHQIRDAVAKNYGENISIRTVRSVIYER